MSSLVSCNDGAEVVATQGTRRVPLPSVSLKPPSSSSTAVTSGPTKTAKPEKTGMSTAKIRKTIMVIEPPPPGSPGENLLVLARFDGVSGMTRSVVFLAMDYLERAPGFIQAYVRGGLEPNRLVAEFPEGMAYTVIRRELVRFVSPLDLAKYEQALDETMRAELGADPHAGHQHLEMTPSQVAELMNQKAGGKETLPTGMYL